MPRLTKIYTRQGDQGYTTIRHTSVRKDDALIELLGTLDELNSWLGLMLAFDIKDETIKSCVTNIQQTLFDFGGELYQPTCHLIHAEHVTALETQLDAWNETLPPLQEFLLPRGNQVTCSCHLARTVCRRAERTLVTFAQQENVNPEMLRYLNRLSDLLFVIARLLAREANDHETLWRGARATSQDIKD